LTLSFCVAGEQNDSAGLREPSFRFGEVAAIY